MAAPKKDEKEKLAPIVIKRIKKGGGGHHGGAWKVAYADFVTAMMAFFLLLWLLNVTTKDQKNAISNYFDPSHPKVSNVVSGAGGILGGMTVAPDGAMVTTVQPIVQTQTPVTTTHGAQQGVKTPDGAQTAEELEKQLREKEDKRFQAAADELKKQIENSPELKDLSKNILIDITPEGLRIQIVDDKGRSMFPSGSAVMYDFMRKILLKVSGVIVALPNQASVRGHTDSNKYKDPSNYDNWNLSADRAQASRRVLVSGGFPESRIENVMGRSDREPLDKDPAAARNRRITIILLRQRPTQAELDKQKAENDKKTATDAATDAANQKALEGQTGTPLSIVDDTQKPVPLTVPMTPVPVEGAPADANTPAPAAVQPMDGNAQAPEYLQPQNVVPLPVAPSPEGFKAQPQVMYFNNDADAQDGGKDSLYTGPAQSPYENKPPRIKTPIFKLDDAPEDASARPGAGVPVTPSVVPPPSTPAQKSVTFGDAVPEQAAPIAPAALPPAPALELNSIPSTPAPAVTSVPEKTSSTPQVLEFGEAPAPAKTRAIPATPEPDLELVNPATTPKKTAPVVVTPIPAPTTQAQPAPSAPKKATKRELEF